MLKVGSEIYVRASESLGSPDAQCVVVEIEHEPGEIPQYPDGLYLVHPVGMSGPDEHFNCCAKGYVYSGPPLHGFLVCFP